MFVYQFTVFQTECATPSAEEADTTLSNQEDVSTVVSRDTTLSNGML